MNAEEPLKQVSLLPFNVEIFVSDCYFSARFGSPAVRLNLFITYLSVMFVARLGSEFCLYEAGNVVGSRQRGSERCEFVETVILGEMMVP